MAGKQRSCSDSATPSRPATRTRRSPACTPRSSCFHVRARLEGTSYFGHDGYLQVLDLFEQDWDDLQLHPGADRRGRRQGPRERPRIRAGGKTSGIQLDVPLVLVYEFRDGRISRLESFDEPEAALRAGPRRGLTADRGGSREGGLLLRRRDRHARRRHRGDRAPQPLLQRAGADRPPDLARRAVPAAAGRVHRGGPDRGLRGRGDGAVRVRGGLRRQRRGVAVGADTGPAPAGAAAGAGSVRRDLDRDHRLEPEVDRHRGPDGGAGLRLAGGDRQAAAGALPDRLRGGIPASPHRSRRCGRPRSPP